MIGRVIREYKILSKLGEGGMAEAFLAERPVLGKCVLKIPHAEVLKNPMHRERFSREAKAQHLKHENIVQVLNYVEEGDDLFLVMEYIEGPSLDQKISQEGILPEKEALSILKNTLKGLNYAHSHGVTHRDVKPSNILIGKDGKAMITDFGIALVANAERISKTSFGAPGTACYMSPEQISNPKNLDHRTDVYSMGIVLYEMLTGQVPFDGDTDYAVQNQHVTSPPPDIRENIPGISLSLAALLNTALSKNPDERFNGCGEFLNYIEIYEAEKKILPVNFVESKTKFWQAPRHKN